MGQQTDEAAARVYRIVSAIPRGKVATYGQIAHMAGMPNQSRMVGRILSRLPRGTRLPWHRVINSQGRISNPNTERQRERLEQEGVPLVRGRIDLRHHQWHP